MYQKGNQSCDTDWRNVHNKLKEILDIKTKENRDQEHGEPTKSCKIMKNIMERGSVQNLFPEDKQVVLKTQRKPLLLLHKNMKALKSGFML